MLNRLFAHPYTRGLATDDPETTVSRRRIIQEKLFLRKLYAEWYGRLAAALPDGAEKVLEIGSGGGFSSKVLKECISSDVFSCTGVDIVLDARHMPCGKGSLRGIVMVDVFHHISDVEVFLDEARYVLRPGGVVAMIEPWITTWSGFVYRRLHHEPIDPETRSWSFQAFGPLSSANSALPWVVFFRDREQFARRYPDLCIERIALDYPMAYLASGGVSSRFCFPGWSYELVRRAEQMAKPLMSRLAMFACIVLRKREQ